MNPLFPTISILLKLFTSSILLISVQTSEAQNVGIGTNNPTRKLSVAGSIVVDHSSQGLGTPDSAALLFGNTGSTAITSKKVGPGPVGTLNFWTNNTARLNIAHGGNIGIGGDPSTVYKLRIYEGDVLVDSSMQVQQRMSIGGTLDANYSFRAYGASRLGTLQTSSNVTIGGDLDDTYMLRVVGGNSRFGGDMHATGNVAFGGGVNGTHRLYVHNGSSYFDGPVQIAGHVNTMNLGASGTITGLNAAITNSFSANSVSTNSLTIDGKGSVRSNGPSSLRVGFDQITLDVSIAANGSYTLNANITDFSGDNDDVRVMVSQVKFNAGNTMFHSNLNINITDIDAAANTCTMVLRNLGNAGVDLKATIYLTTIAKN